MSIIIIIITFRQFPGCHNKHGKPLQKCKQNKNVFRVARGNLRTNGTADHPTGIMWTKPSTHFKAEMLKLLKTSAQICN